MNKKKELRCGYPECGYEIKVNSGGFEVIFQPIESRDTPQHDVLKKVNVYLCHKHFYEIAAAIKLFDQSEVR
jgi:hypothetical protein